MEKICWLDIVLLLPLVVGLIVGIIRGLIAELNALLALVLGVVAARVWGANLALWLHKTCDWSNNISNLLAYVLIFLAVAILLTLLGKAFQKLLKAIKLGWVNHLFGAVFGTLKWAVIMLAIVFVVGKLDQQFQFISGELKQKSIIYQPALDYANQFTRNCTHGS